MFELAPECILAPLGFWALFKERDLDPNPDIFSFSPDEVIEEFKKGLSYLQIAYVYAQRIDWLVSGDDGEESFITRLNDDLSKLKTELW